MMPDSTVPPPTAAGCCSQPPQNVAAAPSRPSPLALAQQRDDLHRDLDRQLTDVGIRLEGLDQFAGPAMAAPLRRSVDTARGSVWSLLSLTARTLAELSNHYTQAELWRGTAQAMVAVAQGRPTSTDPDDPGLATEIRAIYELRLQRDQARAIAASEFEENARLSNSAVELAGARAYAAVLEERLAAWVAAGKIGKEAARTARRAAEANAETAVGQATADAIAARVQAQRADELEADLVAALQRFDS